MDGRDIRKAHSAISSDLIPQVGMEFDTEDKAYNFYKAYAKRSGFGTRLDQVHKDINGLVLDRIFCCCREGKRSSDKQDIYVKSHRPETRCGCLAMVKINVRQKGKYMIEKFGVEHNHDLSSHSKSHLWRSHRGISDTQAEDIEMAASCGIAPKSSFDLLSRKVGGRENLGFIREDYKNYLRTKRTMQMQKGDTGGVLEYLQQIQSIDPNFFYGIQLDEDDLITNIFWADAKMMVDYSSFGDVVCFDTTYTSNRESRPFGLFVGANHHKQTVVFGAALLYDETSASYEWLFETFLKALSDKQPKTILTDQHAGISKALAIKRPLTYHWLCVWHIFQNVVIHLSSVFSRFKDFSKYFSSCVYEYENADEFKDAWQAMLEKYNLESNDWLKRMFQIKEKWALVYGRETFCADMSTTQRSESMNNVVKKYVSYKHPLIQFFEHFQRFLDDRRYEEVKADHYTNQSSPHVPFEIDILKHAISVYTHEVFKLFQEEFGKSLGCKIEMTTQGEEEETEFKVTPKE